MESVLTAPKRADAIRNRARVVDAAREAFAEHGLEVSVDEIARRAAVGKATVYRSFPTKDDLIAGVAIERLRSFERMVGEGCGDDDASAALRRILVAWARAAADDPVIIEVWRLVSSVAELETARADVSAALDRLMRRARRQGRLRNDARAQDVRILFGGMAHALRAEQQRDPKVWGRYANLIADALGA